MDLLDSPCGDVESSFCLETKLAERFVVVGSDVFAEVLLLDGEMVGLGLELGLG